MTDTNNAPGLNEDEAALAAALAAQEGGEQGAPPATQTTSTPPPAPAPAPAPKPAAKPAASKPAPTPAPAATAVATTTATAPAPAPTATVEEPAPKRYDELEDLDEVVVEIPARYGEDADGERQLIEEAKEIVMTKAAFDPEGDELTNSRYLMRKWKLKGWPLYYNTRNGREFKVIPFVD